VDSSGQKFGKSTGGAVWLSPDKLSPYKFYQYLFSVTDADVIKFLKMLTFLPMEEVADLEHAMTAPGYIPNTAQRRLAEEVTRFVHGEEGLQQAVKATNVGSRVHGLPVLPLCPPCILNASEAKSLLASMQALKPGADTKLEASALEEIAGDGPTVSLPRAAVVGSALADIAATTKLLASKSEARRCGTYVHGLFWPCKTS
jgi:tyrosyl-tRNA synthetase